MGGIVCFETLAGIGGHFKIECADSIDSYEVDDAPCEGGGFYDAIVDSSVRTHNYHSNNDGLARLGSDGAQCGGLFGGDDATPDNYYDVDVTDHVSSHTSFKDSEGCVERIIDNWEDTPSEDRDPADLGDNIDYGNGGGGWFDWF